LGGALTGNGATQDGQRFANGMFSFYIDPKVVDPAGFFDPEVARYTQAVKSARPATPGVDVLVPGEPEIRSRAKRAAEGVPLPDDTWASIIGAARAVGLDERRIQAATR
ncbi:Ldh family oxidoreductase, partial [Vineibacter terrae]|uniref:Ldh family oxidoreductase n=1 Tax=Vineibacter terrae TaxID=2586908 RepID=UPI002E2F884A